MTKFRSRTKNFERTVVILAKMVSQKMMKLKKNIGLVGKITNLLVTTC